MASPGRERIDDVPDVFKPFVEEPSFTGEDGVPVVTACLWREATDDQWHHGTIDFPSSHSDPDGVTELFPLLVDHSPEAFQRFAEDYYEVPVDLEAVSDVYALRPLDQELVSSLNAEVTVAELAQDISEIGYPRAHRELRQLAARPRLPAQKAHLAAAGDRSSAASDGQRLDSRPPRNPH
ncbi:hypothetical protein [Streptomyces siamensis]|uniref:Uncharacterized protein n=1 Tax=Streptomyces siamensis TaxID=1274986 RepID=A0ABP9J7D5_9ACTN